MILNYRNLEVEEHSIVIDLVLERHLWLVQGDLEVDENIVEVEKEVVNVEVEKEVENLYDEKEVEKLDVEHEKNAVARDELDFEQE